MKLKHKSKVKLLASKVGKLSKIIKKEKNPMKLIEPDDEEMENNKDMINKVRSRGPMFTVAEDKYIVSLGQQFDGIINMDGLSEIARRTNKRFHNNEFCRSGESMWWHIHREQNKGNEIFQSITIQSGSPKRGNGLNKPKSSVPVEKRGKVEQALKKHPVLPPPPNHSKKQVVKNNSGNMFEILIKDQSGKFERITTTRFSSIEELLFILT